MNLKIVFVLILAVLIQSCDNKKSAERKLEVEKELAKRDSISQIEKLRIEEEKRVADSIVEIEAKIAIGEINFGISNKEFEKKKGEFLAKTKLPKMEYYKNSVFFYHKIGEYGFSRLYGWFDEDKLFQIEIEGPTVEYDEYNRIMPDQFQSLMTVLKGKYGEPDTYLGIPEWTDLDKGYFRRCAIWEIGSKKIEVRVEASGINYQLNLNVNQPEVIAKIVREKEEEEKKSAEDAVDIL